MFFFYFRGEPLHLHSFPTRRSSDLAVARADALDLVVVPDPSLVVQLVGSAAVELGERLERQDRKSTRLNSSHRTISYAVFCLKKKNTHDELATRSHSRVHDRGSADR